jgi:diguanylate cyclase (GGDEF)-like protein
VVVADIDCFKGINHNFGHEAGDDVLRQFADTLRKNTRVSDICGRLGGDEFLVVLTHVNPQHIEMTVSKFREQFAALSFPFQGECISVTASFGVAGFHGRDLGDFRTLVHKADLMLYEAKRAGRNLVRVSFPLLPAINLRLRPHFVRKSSLTIARCLTNTFAGIRLSDVPWFVVAQFVGGFAATLLFRWLAPSIQETEVLIPHDPR